MSDQAEELARLIKRAVRDNGRPWCATRPVTIAEYLLAHGVTLPPKEES